MEWLAAGIVQLAVAVLTLSITLDLRPEHFSRAAREPGVLGLGLLAQLAVLPLLVFGMAPWVPDATVLTALVLVAFTPSGPTSNYLAHLARGDVPLAILLTVLGTLLAAAVMPVGVPWLLDAVTGNGIALATPGAVFASLLWMVLLPLGAGLFAGHRYPAAVARVRPAMSRAASLLFVSLVLLAIASQWRVLAATAASAALPVLATNVAAIASGAAIGVLAGWPKARRDTLALKTGVQNVSIAIGIAIGVLGRLDIAAVAALYGITQLLVASAFALSRNRGSGGAGSSGPNVATPTLE